MFQGIDTMANVQNIRSKCLVCGKELEPNHLDLHFFECHTSVKQEEAKVKSTEDLSVEGENSENSNKASEENGCNICGKYFGRRKNLKIHINVVHQMNKHSCSTCKRTFHKKIELKRHNEYYHDKSATFQCDICNKRFILASKLRSHLETEHSAGGTTTKCNLCGKFISSNLTAHIKLVHESVKPFSCDKCNLYFPFKSGLIKHEKAVHEKLKEHICGQCGKQFSRKAHLEYHKR